MKVIEAIITVAILWQAPSQAEQGTNLHSGVQEIKQLTKICSPG